MNVIPLIEKLNLLESKLGAHWQHSNMEPFEFDASDIVQVHQAGRKIVQHLGMGTLNLVISFVNQNSKVAGSITDDGTKNVFIEIDPKFKDDHEIVLAVLAHEICHKYLNIYRIKLFPEYEQEMLTDAATVYTGLGKFSLNGCEKVNTTMKYNFNETITTTTTNRVGYMDRRQFAFTYTLFCKLRRIPKDSMVKDLRHAAARETRKIQREYGEYFNECYFENDFILGQLKDIVNKEVSDLQLTHAKLQKNIRFVEKSIIPAAKKLNIDFHQLIKGSTDKLYTKARNHNHEAHNYLKNIFLHREINSFKEKIQIKSDEIEKLTSALQLFTAFIAENYRQQIENYGHDTLKTFQCAVCNRKMRISENKVAKVQCPECKYRFIIDTGLPDRIDNPGWGYKVYSSKQGFWKRINSKFKKAYRIFIPL